MIDDEAMMVHATGGAAGADGGRCLHCGGQRTDEPMVSIENPGYEEMRGGSASTIDGRADTIRVCMRVEDGCSGG